MSSKLDHPFKSESKLIATITKIFVLMIYIFSMAIKSLINVDLVINKDNIKQIDSLKDIADLVEVVPSIYKGSFLEKEIRVKLT